MTLFHTQAEQQLRLGFLTWRQVFRLDCRPVTEARPGVRLAGLQGDRSGRPEDWGWRQELGRISRISLYLL